MATEFTPLASTIGGMLIGISAVMLMVLNGRIAGISGILGRLFPPYDGVDPGGAAAFVIGLLVAPFFYSAVMGVPFAQTVSDNVALMAVAGLLVGLAQHMGADAPAAMAFADWHGCRCVHS
jgi:uncharacterized membrane protein YedE/YeeE